MSESAPPSVDRGRASVYAAEIAAFDGTSLEVVVPLSALVELGTRITGRAWWPRGSVTVRRARLGALSSSANHRAGNQPVIRLAAPQMTPATVIHEFAHVLAGVEQGHDSVFRRAHVDLAASEFGAEPAQWLRGAYEAMGLAMGGRQWSRPPPVRSSAGVPIAL